MAERLHTPKVYHHLLCSEETDDGVLIKNPNINRNDDDSKSEEDDQSNEEEEGCTLTMDSLAQITCKCEEANAKDDELYICKHPQCAQEFYCEDCGKYYHHFIGKKKRKNHPFEIEGIQDNKDVLPFSVLMDKQEDTNKFKVTWNAICSYQESLGVHQNDQTTFGGMQLMALIGAERYKKIQVYVEKPLGLVGTNAPMAYMLATELHSVFRGVNAVIKATDSANKAASAAVNASNTFNQAADGWTISRYGGLFTEWIKNPEKQSLYEAMQKARTVQLEKVIEAKDAINSTINIGDALKAGATGMMIATTLEMGIHAYRWSTGQISGKQWCRLLGRSFARNSANLIGTAIGAQCGATFGAQIGASIGTSITPVIGTAIGGGVGILSGIFVGYLMGKGAEAVYDSVFDDIDSEQKQKEKLLQEALLYFNFQPKDITNAKLFNEKRLTKIFRQKALWAHPDRREGDHSEWHRLSTYYGFLKALLDQKASDKQMMEKNMQKLQALQF